MIVAAPIAALNTSIPVLLRFGCGSILRGLRSLLLRGAGLVAPSPICLFCSDDLTGFLVGCGLLFGRSGGCLRSFANWLSRRPCTRPLVGLQIPGDQSRTASTSSSISRASANIFTKTSASVHPNLSKLRTKGTATALDRGLR